MMKMRYLKILIVSVISIIILVGFALIIYFKILFPMPITKDSMENEFSKNKDILQNIAIYLEKQEYKSIYITENDKRGEMFVSISPTEMGKSITISNDKVSDDITYLFEKQHYTIINKSKNGIYFQRWSNRDYGRGVVYSTDGEQPQNELLSKLESLKEKNWYFYEEK